ncbi:ABC transporter ATP-binding protein [Plantactinospora sp. KBS50]|uniref:ABC transporter ATP-binding protein n=1 Tax=Plantactinospora sp. KBS50 TaxID=2024580 RepID=UPI000BAB08CC|nr:ABC transporter ATP-binding protein [Plantactinospora sp. KBS50]ASW55378.1 cobalt ABC transporter ATP-binding protein [Plantactinospora sp. KBS50]
MIEFDRVTVRYADGGPPPLRDVTFRVPEGELCLVAGRTGTGKSTLLRAINGLVPHFTGGTLYGTVAVDGRDTRRHPPRDLADVVGMVGQDPLSGFVTDTVEEELAYGMEQLALPAAVMRKRVEETLDLLGIAELRDRPLRTLSGGQQQRVAIGAVLTSHPRVLVLDEPTSALDPTAAEDVLAAVTRLVHDLGVTVVLAEHRMERVVQYADRMLYLPGDGRVVDGDPAEVLAGVDIAPPLVELGRLAGWTPLPLSVRDARRRAGPLRDRLAGATPPPPPPDPDAAPVLTARKVVVRYPGTVAVAGVGLDLYPGRIVALMGRNGSGKSSLLWAIQGSGARHAGTVAVTATGGTATGGGAAGQTATDGGAAGGGAAGRTATGGRAVGTPGAGGTVDPRSLPAGLARRRVGLVPQSPGDLLYLETVDAECAQSDRESGAPPGTCRALLDQLTPGLPGDRHPRDLSEGQRLGLVLAVQLTGAPPVVLLDEPTRGLDYRAKRQFAAVVRGLAGAGRTVLIATHDVELVATLADRVLVMAEGEIVADGSTAEVMLASPAFAPQVAKVLAPAPWLTVEQVAAALAPAGPAAGGPDPVGRVPA